MRGLILLLLAMVSMSLPVSTSAQEPASIVAARRSGQVGERYDGYLGLVAANASTQLRRDVAAINIRRRALYSDLAARRGVSPQEVGITTACALLRRLAVGEYYLPGQGGWQRVVAGRSPVPSYCS